MNDNPMVEWVCLVHVDYKLTAPASANPKCNHGITIKRVLQPCNKLMWTSYLPWADMGAE